MLKSLCKDRYIQQLEDGIYTTFDEKERVSDYDDKVKGYDALIGNTIYNKLIWGNSVKTYHQFCMDALESANGGLVLDAGCGSLVFTHKAYAQATNKYIILLDRSLGMLRASKRRLEDAYGEMPKHIILVQGDVFDLPFKDGLFDVVISQGMIHIFKEQKAFLEELERVKKDNKKLYFTSLVANNAFGRFYMKLLKNAKEVATIHSSESLEKELNTMPHKYNIYTIGNMAYMQSNKGLQDAQDI